MGNNNSYQQKIPFSTLKRVVVDFGLFFIAFVVIGLDQYTKRLVHQNFDLGVSYNPISWLDPLVTLTYVRNTGAAFGIFPGMKHVFMVVALVVVVLIINYHRQLTANSWLLHLAFGLQLGGAVGNLIDRLFLGYVIDFIDFRVWPVFNVADSAVVVGATLLVYYTFFLSESTELEGEPESLDSEIACGS